MDERSSIPEIAMPKPSLHNVLPVVFLVVLLAAQAARACAMQPIEPSDTDLVEEPIIVIAHWTGAKIESNRKMVWDSRATRFALNPDIPRQKEVVSADRTEIAVERVIKDRLAPGIYKVFLSGDATWKIT